MCWLEATYLIRSTPEQIEARAQALAIEQSLEMPPEAVQQPWILTQVLAQVASITLTEKDTYKVVLRLALETTAKDPIGLFNGLFGNCSLQEDVWLQDVELPGDLLEAFPGPRFGIAGLRRLTGVYHRALTCTALKPQGLSPNELARLAYTFALGGIDIVKDDHNLTNQSYAPFAQRVPAIARAVAQANAETGRQTLYAPMLAGSPKKLAAQLEVARSEGIRVALVAPMLVGLPVFYELAQEAGVALLAHPAFAGNRMAPSLFLGKLFRLLGADASIFPNYGGRFAYSPQECQLLAQNLRNPWGPLQPALPVPAGGMTVERVDELLAFYGPDSMLLIGGNLLAAREELLERTRRFVERVAARSAQPSQEAP